MGRLSGKTALVTGGAQGLGRASAIRLARDGAAVVIADVDAEAAGDVVSLISKSGGRASTIYCDILLESEIQAAVDHAIKNFGSLDIMFNNAAALPQEIMVQDVDILTISTEAWDDLFAGALRSVMLGCRHAVLQMREQENGGSIINTSSMYGVMPFNRNVAYGTAKAAVVMLTQYVATAFGAFGIRCNAIAPSMIRTELLERSAPEDLIRINEENVLTRKLGTPDDIANIVAFLASDDSAYLTGQLIRADGGTTSHLPTYTAAKKFFESMEQ